MTVGQRVNLKGYPGEGEVLAVHGEGSVSVGWEGVGLRIHHDSQLVPAQPQAPKAPVEAPVTVRPLSLTEAVE